MLNPLPLNGDHSKSFDKFEKFGFETFSPKNIQDGKIIDLPNWKIMPMKLIHNVECFGFLIFSKIENKKIVYCTDTTYIPQISGDVDLYIIDCNYDEEIVFDKLSRNEQINLGYRNHCSTQKIYNYFKEKNKIKKLCPFHISNSSLQDINKIKEILSPITEELIIAEPNTIINV